MGWGVATYVFGGIAILGPILLVFWYAKAARQKFREFAEATGKAGKGAAGDPPGSGSGD
jgi:hypothetical protein